MAARPLVVALVGSGAGATQDKGGDNGVRVFGVRTTVAPSGSFEVERRLADRSATDRITASATNTEAGEPCHGSSCTRSALTVPEADQTT